MKVYHGSYTEIDVIDLAFCETGKDFGQGFYVTKLREQAEFWAKKKGERKGKSGYVTEYDFDEFFFERNDMIKFLRFEDYNEEWLEFVVLNRKNKSKHQIHDYDIVEGPVANDKIATEVDKYIEGKIDIAIYDIGDKVVQSLMTDYNINELDAVDRYYTSNTYTQLANESTEFYKKTWQEIYDLLKQELK